MRAKDLRGMGVKEINEKMTELQKELLKDRAQVATGTTPKSPGRISNSKRIIARMITILKEKGDQQKHE